MTFLGRKCIVKNKADNIFVREYIHLLKQDRRQSCLYSSSKFTLCMRCLVAPLSPRNFSKNSCHSTSQPWIEPSSPIVYVCFFQTPLTSICLYRTLYPFLRNNQTTMTHVFPIQSYECIKPRWVRNHIFVTEYFLFDFK